MNRATAIKNIRKKLLNGEKSIGSWMQIPSSSVAEIMGQAGYDWVAIDQEHGSISTHQLPDLFRALELGNTLPLVRVAEGSPKNCKQALDAGAGGVIIPMIKTAEQIIKIRDFCCWPPNGQRGVGFSRANLFGKHFEAYKEEAESPIIVAMIESFDAVQNLEEILSVKGLDAILVGPYDLSASMGLTGKFDDPDFVAVMDGINKISSENNIPAGIHIISPSRSELDRRLVEGYRFIAYSIDAVMLNSVVSSGAI